MQTAFSRLTPIALLLAAVMLLAACGSDSDSDGTSADTSSSAASDSKSSHTADQAVGEVDQARVVVTKFDRPSNPPKSVPQGKKIAVLYPVAVPLPLRASESVQTAAKELGWETTLIDGRGSPEGYVNAMDQAISAGVDGIVLVAMPVPLLAEQIGEARKQGISVTSVLPGLPEGDAKPAEFNLDNYVSTNHDEEGYLMGEWVVQDAPEGAKAIALESPEFPDLTRQSKEFQRALSDAGPNYEVVDTLESPVTDSVGSQGAQRLAAALKANPEAKYAFVLFTNTFLQALELSGRDDVIGLSADVDGWVPAIQEGAPLVLVGFDARDFGWYAVDGLIRAFNGEPQPGADGGGYEAPSRLVDSKNAGEIKGDSLEVGYDAAEEWLTLWGLR